jgi:hypothetical protein
MTTEAEIAERRARLLGPMNGLSVEELKREVGETFAKLGDVLESLSDQQATWKPDAEEWSAAQVGDHVAIATGVMINVTRVLAGGKTVTDADWDPPPQFRGDVSDLADVKKRLVELPAHTDELFARAVSTDRMDQKANNSMLGDMNWREWFYFLGVHAKSHIEQIEKLQATRGFPG